MTEQGRKLIAAVMLVLAVFCWRLGFVYATDMERYRDLATVRLSGSVLAEDAKAIERLESEAADPLGFALWSEHGGETVEAPDFARSVTAAVLTLRGDSRLVLPGSAALDPADLRGCLIDRESALALFGGGNVTGSFLRWRGEDYEIRGVVELPVPAIIVNLPLDSETPLELLTLASGDTTEFLTRHGLSSKLTVRGVLFSRIAAVLAWLPVFVAAVLVFAALCRQRRRWKEYTLRSFALSLAAWTVAAVVLLRLIAVVPAEFIPGRWSDFTAWGELLVSWRQNALLLFAGEKPAPELRMTLEALKAAWGLAATAFLLQCGRALRKEKHRIR